MVNTISEERIVHASPEAVWTVMSDIARWPDLLSTVNTVTPLDAAAGGVGGYASQIAKLVGVAPMNRDTGQGSGKRRIRGGRSSVRVALYMATLSAVCRDPMMKARYLHLRERGKLGKIAPVACMRKVLGIVNVKRRDELRAERLGMV